MLAGLAHGDDPDGQSGTGRREAAPGDEETAREATPRVSRRRFTFDCSRTRHATVIALGGELDVVCADRSSAGSRRRPKTSRPMS